MEEHAYSIGTGKIEQMALDTLFRQSKCLMASPAEHRKHKPEWTSPSGIPETQQVVTGYFFWR